MTFLLCGLMHAVGDVTSGMSWQESGATRFFVTQALGIVLEDGVQAIYRSASGHDRIRTHPPLWTRFIGYLWLLSFLTWSSPAWFYPLTRTMNQEAKDMVVHFSFVALAKRMAAR